VLPPLFLARGSAPAALGALATLVYVRSARVRPCSPSLRLRFTVPVVRRSQPPSARVSGAPCGRFLAALALAPSGQSPALVAGRSPPVCGGGGLASSGLALSVLFWGCVVALAGFSGSRSLSLSFAGSVSRVVGAAVASGLGVAVGCAAGADAFVRSAAPGARVFRASAFSGPPAARLVSRSVALVRAVAASGPSARFFGFVVGPCPRSVAPSASSSACFCGGGSGSWASLAFAVGLGLPMVVFWYGSGAPALPS
jgi:hypothetical protein